MSARHLYVHVPFCAHRCGYCDFVTTSASPELHERYVAALGVELEQRGGSSPGSYETIFVGGGTPTLLVPEAIEQLLQLLAPLRAPGCELTIECNPETVDAELAARLVDGGVSRVSLGVQSMQHAQLQTLERRADPTTIRRAVALLREAGIDNLSCDVIWAIPGQREADVHADLSALVELAPNHVSAYELEFKPGTRLTHAWGNADAAVGDHADAMYDAIVDGLGAAGYRWYETANFAQQGRECRHNLAYWTQQDYLGIGIGAVGTY
jgi:oxygen-independent coproporphyrinogen-3 oxidase